MIRRTVIGSLTLALLAACCGLPFASAEARATTPATVKLSSSVAGARPVALALIVSYDMQCGYPGPGPVRVLLPATEHVPTTIAPTSILVDGKAAASIHVAGHTLIVGLPAAPQIMCDVIASGKLTIAVTHAAGLGNPATTGSYSVNVARGDSSFTGRFSIHAG